MHRFKNSNLLKAFSKIVLRDTKSDRENRNGRKSLGQSSQANQTRHPGEPRCFNCNATGHR